jgi:hypothetical protein
MAEALAVNVAGNAVTAKSNNRRVEIVADYAAKY